MLLPTFDVGAAWKNVKLATGAYVCQDDASGAQFKPPYTAKADVTKACNVLTSFVPWLSTADAAPIVKTLNCAANPDGSCSTQYPCVVGDGSDCKPPGGLTLACNDSGAPSLAGLVANGSAYDENVGAYFSGTGKSTATYSITTVSGTNAATANWSLTGTIGTTLNLHNTAANPGSIGSGALKVGGTVSGNTVFCSARNWSYVAPPSTDTNPPNPVTGINVPSTGVNTVTVAFDATTDPNDAVNRKGIASYRIKLNGTQVDTLTASSAGLVNDFTSTNIGSPTSVSVTQSAAPNGGQWTLQCAAYGLENGQPSDLCTTLVPITGDGCVIGKIGSITTAATFGKTGALLKNSNSTNTDATLALVVLKQGSTYFLQYSIRPTDGGSLSTSSSTAIGSTLPYTKLCLVGSTASISYSLDGGAWTSAFSGISITLNASHFAGLFASGTNTGADRVLNTAVWTSARVQTETSQLSKTVSTMTGGTWTVTAADQETPANESTAVGSAMGSPASGGGSVHKWTGYIGQYVRAHTAKLNCGSACDASRHNLYAQIFGTPDANIIGTSIWYSWKTIENDAGGDFTAGIAAIRNEISFFKTNYPGKKIALLLDFSPYGWSHGQDNQVFPQYLVDAGCTYDENNASSSGGATSLNWFKTVPACFAFYQRLINALGTALDSETALAYIRIQQETDDSINCCGISPTAEDTAWKNIAQATVTAFPTTNVWIPVNWTGVNTAASVEALLVYYKSIGAGFGDGDTIAAPNTGGMYSWAYSCPSTATGCVMRGLNASIGASSHDYCGEFVSFRSVELSEMGYGSVGGHPGYTAAMVASIWNNQSCAQFGEWEPNFGETFDVSTATQYWDGAQGQKWAIDTIPLTHTAKPAGYN